MVRIMYGGGDVATDQTTHIQISLSLTVDISYLVTPHSEINQ